MLQKSMKIPWSAKGKQSWSRAPSRRRRIGKLQASWLSHIHVVDRCVCGEDESGLASSDTLLPTSLTTSSCVVIKAVYVWRLLAATTSEKRIAPFTSSRP